MKLSMLNIFYVSSLVILCQAITSTASQNREYLEARPCNRSKWERASLENTKMCVKDDTVCIPANYSKFELPNKLNVTEVKHSTRWLEHSL